MSADKSRQTAILKTLAYADIFNQSLSADELTKYLIGYKAKDASELNLQNISAVRSQNDNWVLSGREELLQLKESQILNTKYKIQQVEKYLSIFRLLPWIKAVGITGSVAAGTPTPTDDIDLLIITDPKRMWLSRLLLTAMLNLVNKRRKPNAKLNQINNKFCLNMWLSQDNLTEEHHDLYTANELARIIPILNRNHTYEHYLEANLWLNDYLPNFAPKMSVTSSVDHFPHPTSHVLNILDQFAEKLQRKVMRKQTIETVHPNRLAFHPHDYRTEILDKYNRRLLRLKIESV